ncbi:MAG TPA: hypothetical protein VL137_09445, partial [Polyangiaceae bacterium]|nr:hypothetical protein [Polyangiaceae bacterium]
LDDARSEFVYTFFPKRAFTATSSMVGTGSCGNYHGAQHGDQEEFASITYFIVQSMADLATKLAAIQEGDSNVLSNFHITFTSGMHGSNHDGLNLPTLMIGGGGGVMKTDNSLDLGDANMADLHLTVMKSVFGCPDASFGTPMGGYTSGTIPALLA